jgi:putative transposase
MDRFGCKEEKHMERRNRHSVYDLEYHLVVVTRYRHPVIKGELADALLSETRRLFKGWRLTINSLGVGIDHVHIMFEAPPKTQLSKIVNSYKTATSRLMRKRFAKELSPYYWKPRFWSMSYYIGSVSERSHEAVSRYIENQ